MSVVDGLVLLVLGVSLLVGLGTGLVAGLGSLLGLGAGAVASVWLVPLAAAPLAGSPWRAPVLVAMTIALLAVGTALGTGLASRVGRGVEHHPLRLVDRLLGGALNLVVAALVVSLVGTSLATAGVPRLSPAVASSEVLRRIEELTPDPVSRSLAAIETMVRDDALPAVGGMLWDEERAPMITVESTPAPPDLQEPEVQRATDSVARINASSYRCAIGAVGSGFVVAEDRIMTNAHVVAGSDGIVVELPGRPAADASVVHFDPAMDIAVLDVAGDAAGEGGAAVLRIGPDLTAGDGAVIAGYPRGGPMTTVPAGVMGVGSVLFPQPGQEDPRTAPRREAYRLAAEVQPGNSGGPVFAEDGSVAGMIFARDDSEAGIAWAVTSDEVSAALATVPADAHPVDTGECAG